MAKGLDPQLLQNVALIVLVKTILESEGKIRLTEEDFAKVDALGPESAWTIDVDKNGDVVIGFSAKEG